MNILPKIGVITVSLFLCACLTQIDSPSIPQSENSPEAKEDISSELYYPIDNFTAGITKKPFGVYITPETSPVQPERFTGYHTGVDIETTPEQQDEPVQIYSISDGTIELNRFVNGYGGVLILSFKLNGQSYSALYGHLKTPTDISVGDEVSVGQTLTVLGTGFSNETDGERKHLHFSLRPGIDLTLNGYVQKRSELSAWIDPQEFFSSHSAAEPE
ncbi:MAG: M23 family metallopeptidase [Candidatus Peribacteraceae bacterium]|nr:M23 family metallopeptidase [Candidatus Peribacteraceae bacterium]